MKIALFTVLISALCGATANADIVRVGVSSIFSNDPAKAFEWYTKVLGFEGSDSIYGGQHYRFVNVKWQKEYRILIKPGAPSTGQHTFGLETDDLDREGRRLKDAGAEFVAPPVGAKAVTYSWGIAAQYPWGIEADIKDPDGQIVAVTEE